MTLRFEAFEDENGITFVGQAERENLKEKNLLDSSAKLLHVIVADTPEEAMAVHHIKMGWEPYKPMGDPQLCPNNCQSYFYPEGSGICPKCGGV